MRFNALLCLFRDGHRGRLLHRYIYSLYVVVFLIQVLFGQRGPTTLTASWLVCLFVCLLALLRSSLRPAVQGGERRLAGAAVGGAAVRGEGPRHRLRAGNESG